jgi:hypothetical protein
VADSTPERPELAAIRKMRESAFQFAPQEETEERKQLLRKFRRERLREKLKQAAAAAAYLIPVCLIWWQTGAAHRLLADLPRLFGLLLGLIQLVVLLLVLAFHGLILWMIVRKVGEPRWNVSWNVIFLCILFNAAIYLMAILGHQP